MGLNLVCFDQDGTLVQILPQHKQAYEEACKIVYGVDAELVPFRNIGGTAQSTLITMLEDKLPLEQIMPRLPKAIGYIADRLEALIDKPQQSLLPGVRDILEALNADPFSITATYTGNAPQMGGVILARHGIRHYFDLLSFSQGAQDRRKDILGRLIAGAESRYHEPPERIVVIGDSRDDHEAGKAFGATTVLMATGGHSLDELSSYGPNFALLDMKSDAETLQHILRLQ